MATHDQPRRNRFSPGRLTRLADQITKKADEVVQAADDMVRTATALEGVVVERSPSEPVLLTPPPQPALHRRARILRTTVVMVCGAYLGARLATRRRRRAIS